MRVELMAVDLPFRQVFRHAAAARRTSESLFVKFGTSPDIVGYGESLPRRYVTGETRDDAFALLESSILPRLFELEFDSMEAVRRFLERCDGKAPPEWVSPDVPQSAAWCAVDLALLDAFGRAYGEPVRACGKEGLVSIGHGRAGRAGEGAWQQNQTPRYSGVVSAGSGWRFAMSLLKLRLYGFAQVKLKLARREVPASARLARRILGPRCELRVDANQAWTAEESITHIRALQDAGIHCFEQPLNVADTEGAARLVRETGAEIFADESFSDRESLERLLARRACTGVNVRISKCGGLIAAAKRCEEARRAGVTLQIGCQVGESSLLSAAQLILIAAYPARYLEGCYGRHLLRSDPVHPRVQLGYGGRLPRLPGGAGLGVKVDETECIQWIRRRAVIERRVSGRTKGNPHVTRSESDLLARGTAHGQGI